MRNQAVEEQAGNETRRGGLLTIPVRHPRATVAVISAGVVLAVLAFLWFRPDKLFVDATVDDVNPLVASTAPAGGSTNGTLSVGSFRNLEHETKGRAHVLALSDGRRVLRL